MSTDIHMYAEVMNHGSGAWEKVGRIFDGDGRDSEGMMHLEPKAGDEGDPNTDLAFRDGKTDHPYAERNYTLFGILCGNRHGQGIHCIGAPRGIPEDASRIYRTLATSSSDWHSHSWFTVAELIAWPLWQSPVSYGQDTDDPIWLKRYHLESERASHRDEMTEAERKAGSDRFMALIDNVPQRVFTARDVAAEFYSKTIPALLDLGEPEDVRILFFLDN